MGRCSLTEDPSGCWGCGQRLSGQASAHSEADVAGSFSSCSEPCCGKNLCTGVSWELLTLLPHGSLCFCLVFERGRDKPVHSACPGPLPRLEPSGSLDLVNFWCGKPGVSTTGLLALLPDTWCEGWGAGKETPLPQG